MSLHSMLTENVVVLRQADAVVDDYNTPTDEFVSSGTYGDQTWGSGSWGDFAVALTFKARIEPVEERELTAGRDTRISDFRMFVLPTVTIDALSQVRDSAGRIYQVVGAPAVQRTPRGPHHQELQLRYIEG